MTDESQGAAAWHAMDVERVLEKIESRRDGLDQEEVERRKEKFGPNKLPSPKKRSPLRRFLGHFNNILIYVLIVAAIVTAFLQHWVDTGVILGVVAINALIGFIQEGKAEKALEAIEEMLPRKAQVVRSGIRQTIPADDLVPGDIVYLKSGDGVPADLRLIETRNLLVEEAALTGESEGVEKKTDPVEEKAVAGERYCTAYSGTTVSSGRGVGVVVATGNDTEIGKIRQMMAAAEKLTTPLLEAIDQFGRVLTVVILGFCAATFGAGYFWREMEFGEVFLAVVGIAVAAIPEGLPAIITIILAVGVREMARQRSIIRQLPAVETLGSVTVICSDKTGTLTRNEITAKTAIADATTYEVSGSGYAPEGEIRENGKRVDLGDGRHAVLREMLLAGLLCNDANLREDGKGWHVEGDPTEGALIPLAIKGGLDPTEEAKCNPRRATLPFESERRLMATVHAAADGGAVIYVKGAPERVLEMCNRQLTRDGEEDLDSEWKTRFEKTASRGYRLLAAARKKVARLPSSLEDEDLGGDFVFFGVFGLMDPPREGAIRAVKECRSGGIRVKMITGDYALTARSIGEKLGIDNGIDVLTGADLEDISDEELPKKAAKVNVFARATPEHKIRLVRALQRNGEIVAMTGDGVNDAPALKQANVGVAMGIKGTEVAKQAAEMIIVDDNFVSIIEAVKEGRRVYDNIKKSILFVLPTNGGESLVIVVAILFGLTLPITPVQILWVNMVTAVTLALALAFEPREDAIMERPPRETDQPLLSLFGIWRVVFVSFLMLGAVLGFYFWALGENQSNSLDYARTVAVNTIIICEVFYLFNTRFVFEPTFSRKGIFGNKHAIGAVGIIVVVQALFTYLPQAQFIFGTEALPARVWLYMLPVGIALYAVVEIEKLLVRKFLNTHSRRIRP